MEAAAGALRNPKVRNTVAGAMVAALVGLYAQVSDLRATVAAYAQLHDTLAELKLAIAEQRTTTTALQVQLARLEAVQVEKHRR